MNLKPSPIDKIAHHRGAPWYWCSLESGGKCAGCWRKHKPKECKGTARSTMSAVRSTTKECKGTARSMMSAVRSTTKAKSGDAEKLKLLLLKALSVVMNEGSDKDADME
jgi:hypothetical protein